MEGIAAGEPRGLIVEPVSPELALVDPELRARALVGLPDAGTRGHDRPAAAAPPPPAAEPDASPAAHAPAPAPAAHPVAAAPRRERSCVVPSILAGMAGALVVALLATFSGPPEYAPAPTPPGPADPAATVEPGACPIPARAETSLR